uniref:RING-type domain-containing protein n=1 Tax=Glossina austeni TaxID=7395 RepID=A0A1A9V9E7_GLOAU
MHSSILHKSVSMTSGPYTRSVTTLGKFVIGISCSVKGSSTSNNDIVERDLSKSSVIFNRKSAKKHIKKRLKTTMPGSCKHSISQGRYLRCPGIAMKVIKRAIEHFRNQGLEEMSLLNSRQQGGNSRRELERGRDSNFHARIYRLWQLVNRDTPTRAELIELFEIIKRWYKDLHKTLPNILKERLPISTYNPEGDTEFQTSCAMCLSDFQLNDLLRTLPCNHKFHAACVDKWLKIEGTCPLCRRCAFTKYCDHRLINC